MMASAGASLRWSGRFGVPGVIAAGVLLFCAVMYATASRPLGHELARLEAELAAARGAAGSAASAPRGMEALLRELPPEHELAERLAQIHRMAAKHGVVLRQGSFDTSIERGNRIARQQMSFQAQAPYPAVRRFIRDALAAMPALALEDATLTRARGEAGAIEASLRFSILLARTGGK